MPWPDHLWHLLQSSLNVIFFAASFLVLVALIVTRRERRAEMFRKRPITATGMGAMILGAVLRHIFSRDFGDVLTILGLLLMVAGLMLEKKPRPQFPPQPDSDQSEGDTVWPPSIKPPV